ncbi:MAG TPA: hypothetical protein VNF51_00065 [Candidatus Paceibacterota bacterium]|nr:hypothetical protein [Candidatus Paceibacterota bacterium]
MDTTATNYNSNATSPGSCTYPSVSATTPTAPATVYGCMDKTATNYNSNATSQTGITCTYPSPVVSPPALIYGCMDKTATNYNSNATSQTGITCTYPSAPSGGGAGGSPPTYGGGGGGGGSGGELPPPTITLVALPHIVAQPLAYLYLSQIPYTGLDLGPVGTVLYWFALIVLALVLAYLVLFTAVPAANRHIRYFAFRVSAVLNLPESAPAGMQTASVSEAFSAAAVRVAPARTAVSEASYDHPTYDGFKSFAHNGALSIEDIVKSLSRHQVVPATEQKTEPIQNIEPIYEKVEPVYEDVEPIAPNPSTETTTVPADVRGFTTALLEGDRAAVFVWLRQHARESGAPEQLVTSTVCLLDDVYRARIDGTPCDSDIARMAARLSTPTLEKLVTALTTAIDASYSTGATGAKLAIVRALAVLGA